MQKRHFFPLVIWLSYHSSKICQVSAISIHSCPKLCTLLTILILYSTLAFDPLVSEIYPSAIFVVSYAWTNPTSLKKIGEGHFRHWLRWLGMTLTFFSFRNISERLKKDVLHVENLTIVFQPFNFKSIVCWSWDFYQL